MIPSGWILWEQLITGFKMEILVKARSSPGKACRFNGCSNKEYISNYLNIGTLINYWGLQIMFSRLTFYNIGPFCCLYNGPFILKGII